MTKATITAEPNRGHVRVRIVSTEDDSMDIELPCAEVFRLIRRLQAAVKRVYKNQPWRRP